MASKTKKIIEIDVQTKGAASMAGVSKSVDKLTGSVKTAENALEDLEAQQRKVAGAAGLAGVSVMEMGRIASDLPYGLRGVANNISQLATLLGALYAQADGAKNSFKALAAQMKGPLGVIVVFQIALAAVQMFQNKLSSASKAAKNFAKAMKEKGGLISEMEIAAQVMRDNAEGSEAYEGALKKLKDNGFDPATESVQQFIDKQFELAMIQAELAGYTERELERKEEERDLNEKLLKQEEKIADFKKTNEGRAMNEGRRNQLRNLEIQAEKTQAKIDESRAESKADRERISSDAARGMQIEGENKAGKAASKEEDKEGKPREILKTIAVLNQEDFDATAEEARTQLDAITKAVKEKQDELMAEDEAAKIEVKREKALLEIEEITNDEVAKREAILATNAYYDELQIQQEQATKDAMKAIREKELTDNLDTMARMFGEQSRAGKAALFLKMNHAKISKAINDGVTWDEIKNNVVKGVSDFSTGLSKAASSAPFPFNVPLIAAHSATAMPHLMAVKNALSMFKGKKSGGAPSMGAVGSTGGAAAAVTASSISAPSFNVVGVDNNADRISSAIEGTKGQTVKAYVVASDVSGAQELDRKTEDKASI